MTDASGALSSRRHFLPTGPEGGSICVDAIGPPDAASTVVVLHGLGSASTVAFHPSIRTLSQRPERWLLLDLPGFGVFGTPERLAVVAARSR